MKDISVKKYDYIDALRGIAILGVVLVHAAQWIHPSSVFLFLVAKEGQQGVQLFYLASALTLFLSMGSRNRRESRATTKFFIRRFFRIAPLFYIAIVVYTLYSGLSARYWAPDGMDWWYVPLTAIFMHGWHPETLNSVVPGGWSIAIEMTFYLLVPFLFTQLTDIRRTLIVLFAAIVLSSVLSPIVKNLMHSFYPPTHYFLIDHFVIYWFFSQLPIFIMGILTYHIIKKNPYKDKQTGLILLMVSLFIFLAALTATTFQDIFPRHMFFGIGFVFLALSLHFFPNILLVNKVITTIGKLSFSIYLAHFMVLYISQRVFKDGFVAAGNTGTILAFLLVLGGSVTVAYFTHRFVEKPGIQFGKRIIERM